ncbi:MAG: hypothetical protein KGD67_09320 [Candidatus Lokiarchaeota archaeon]|nr:hypothetical protein [Candidatus Lokiarchaeota archaeon]
MPKQSNYDFHLKNLKGLVKDFKYLQKIPGFPLSNKNFFYSRDDESGWWMATKQIIIRKYIGLYLNILGAKKDIDLFFIDLLGSWGMNRVSKRNQVDTFEFPGTSISAPLISNRKKRGFTEFFVNDLDREKREVLIKRYKALNTYSNNRLVYNIPVPDLNDIDSNEWVIDVLNQIRYKYQSKIHCLFVIDNQGMDINLSTIRKIREITPFADFVITFHDVAYGRGMHSKKIEEFIGTKVKPKTKREDLYALYIEQLKSVGIGRIEPIRIYSGNSFYYTLLFCCRNQIDAKWLNTIKRYSDVRFRSWTAENNKQIWDVIEGKIISLDSF